MRRFALLLALLAFAAPPAAAQSVRPSAAAPLQTPLPLRAPQDDPSLTSSGFRRQSVVATPRLGREFDDGSSCRLSCAPAYYNCQSEIDRRPCAPRWAECLSDCRKVPLPR
jgi:hypothetical protein